MKFEYQLILAFIISLALGVLSGPIIIKELKKLKFGQNVRHEGLESHLKKQGVTTMGGIIFIVAILITSFIMLGFKKESLIINTGLFLFGMIGFLDDYLKIKRKQSEGLTAKQKIILNIIFSIIMAIFIILYFNYKQGIQIPYLGFIEIHPAMYIPFIIIFYTAVTNSVNLADGVDGLCGSVSSIVTGLYLVLLLTKAKDIGASRDLAIYSALVIGGLFGYLVYNWHPAKVFMGDSGSFALGGILGTLSILTKTEILFILIGLIYVIESLSVIIQVTYYKKTKKRVFLMAPIHHHFEKDGWSELKIVAVFSLFTLICCIFAYILY